MRTLRFNCPPLLASLVVDLFDANTLVPIGSDFATTEVATGLYTCAVGSLSGLVYVVANAGPLVATGWANLDVEAGGFVEVYNTLSEAQRAAGVDATPGTTLSVDYSHEWLYVDGVEDCGFEFGPQRGFAGTPPVAPTSGVKIRRANPSKNDLITATAMGVRIETTDMTVTVWSETLNDGTTIFAPERADYFTLGDEGRLRILSLTRTIDGAQWRCLCRFTTEVPAVIG